MMITCTRKLTFETGHRVFGHESKCAHFHGHSYKAFITAQAPQLDSCGRIIDFSVLKQLIGGWIDSEWDHGFLLWEKDPAVTLLYNFAISYKGKPDAMQKLFCLPYVPTAENIARYLLEVVCPRLLNGTGVVVTAVKIDETENCSATATLSEIRG